MPERPKPVASLSLDLDNLWSYLKTHGDRGWESRPTYLPRVVPVALDLLATLDLHITFFIVGLDAARDENGSALQEIVAAGHEVGNHSFEHEPWLSRYTPDQLDEELHRAEEAIRGVMGVSPTGFRGPGYSWSPDLLRVLARRGYRYDASTLPTFLGPLARWYYFATARLSREEKDVRSELFGQWTAGFWPNRAHRWDLGAGTTLLEIPVTVFPVVRTPFHLSYLLYLARHSEALALAYWRAALASCRLTGVEPSILLHPLDLVGPDVAPELQFFPGMQIGTAAKVAFAREVLSILRDEFEVVTMEAHAARFSGRSLRTRPVGDPAPALRPALET